MAKEEFMNLQHSESTVANMAATIFAGLIQKPELAQASEDALIEKSVSIAVKMAIQCEKLIKSDQEWLKKEPGSSYLGG
jgi:hypothetical protein